MERCLNWVYEDIELDNFKVFNEVLYDMYGNQLVNAMELVESKLMPEFAEDKDGNYFILKSDRVISGIVIDWNIKILRDSIYSSLKRMKDLHLDGRYAIYVRIGEVAQALYAERLETYPDDLPPGVDYIAVLFPNRLVIVTADKDIHEDLKDRFRNCEDIEVKFYDGSS